jgi:tellurite resistance protein TerC
VESAVTVVVWCLLALAFNGLIACWKGSTAGLQFSTGYLLEWSLSMDNVFVFAVIFRCFQVPKIHQYRILYWGILGAIVMRLTFILAGAALISRFEFILPLLGFFLLYAAFRLAWHSSARVDPRRNLVFRLARRWLPLAEESGVPGTSAVADPRPASGYPGCPGSGLNDASRRQPDKSEPAVAEQGLLSTVNYGGRFLVRQAGRLRIAPPLLVLLVVESTDVLFAVDSVPAIFGITRDPFIMFTSNVFAILGLRALYFLLAGVMDLFCYLHYGLAAVLAFVGLKMVGESWLPHAPGTDIMPAWASLAVIAALLGMAITASLLAGKGRIEN